MSELASGHRYLDRVCNLIRRLQRLLAERDRTVRITVLGVDHTGHVFPDLVPSLAEADLVTLELPTTPVKAFLVEGRREEVQVRNIFWQDLLTYYARHPPPSGVFGVNVNPHVRYLRGRFYYQDGFLVNDFEAPLMVVEPRSGKRYLASELGGDGERRIAAEAVLAAVSPDARATFEANGLAHVGPGVNPFGRGRHLVLLAPPPAELLALSARIEERLRAHALAYGLGDAALSRLAFSQYVEGFLLPINDFYLVEQLLLHVIRAVGSLAAPEELRVTHVAGRAHLEIVERYLTLEPSPRVRIETETDPRFPLHPGALTPGSFPRHIGMALHGVSLKGAHFAVDLGAADRMLDRYAADEPHDLERRVLLRAIWTRDRPPTVATEFRTLAEETPLEPTAEYVDEYATQLDRCILEYALAEQSLPALREINARLRERERRGLATAVAQELHEHGVGYRELLTHAVLGVHARQLDAIREGLLSGTPPHTLFAEAFRIQQSD